MSGTELAQTAAARFTEMARKVSENAANGFSGAVVIHPPFGDPIEWLLVGMSNDQSLFWSTLQTQITIKLEELKNEARGPQAAWR